MPQERLSMREIRGVLRYRFSAKLSLEATARALKISKGVVAKYIKLANTAGLAKVRELKQGMMQELLTGRTRLI